MPLRRHAALILVPVLLLAGIAVFGLVEYRHAITAEARATALSPRWSSSCEQTTRMGSSVAPADWLDALGVNA